jgi:hypothetical protein
MTYRRRQRWLRRLALGFAFATALFAGKVTPAAAVVDEGGSGTRIVSAGGWSGVVDADTGIPLSAGIPQGDEQYVSSEATQVIPYLSQGILTQEQANALQAAPSGDEVAFSNAIASQPAEVFIPGVTDFPKPTVTATRPDDRADRFTGVEQPPVISYLSQGMGANGEVGARPDNRADRFAHSDVASRPELASSGWNIEWNEALSVGIGALVLVLALGLGLGYLRRPRLAL